MGRFTTILTGTLAVALTGCEGRRAERPAPPAVALPATAASTPDPAPAPTGHAASEAWKPESLPPGIVALDPVFSLPADSYSVAVGALAIRYHAPRDTGRAEPRTTVWLRGAPRADAAPVGALARGKFRDVTDREDESRDATGLILRLFGPPGTTAHLYDYEDAEFGVLVDSVAGGWARVVVGWDSAGTRVVGWADTSDTNRVKVMLWPNRLRGEPLYFVSGAGRLYASLADTLTPGEPLPPIDNREFGISRLETRGPWMRIRLTWPVGHCGRTVDTTATTTREVWVRYRNRGVHEVAGPIQC